METIPMQIHSVLPMDAHVIRNSKWQKRMNLDKIKLTLTGYSRAAYRTGFYIPELNILLDAGNQSLNQPSHIFITHCHGDHVAELPFTLIRNEDDKKPPTQIFGPIKSKPFVLNYIRALFDLNCLHHTTPPDVDYTETEPDISIPLMLRNSNYTADVLGCDHSVPTVSYVFSLNKQKLKPEYHNMTGREIVELKANGIQITDTLTLPLFAFVCDCSIQTVETYQDKLFSCQYVIIECTFLHLDDLEQAYRKKHIHWMDLKPFVKNNPEVTFILIHFSMKHKDQEIYDFFQEEGLPNVVPWINVPTTD